MGASPSQSKPDVPPVTSSSSNEPLPPEPSAVPPVMSSSSRRLLPNRFGRNILITPIPSQEEPDVPPVTSSSSNEPLPPEQPDVPPVTSSSSNEPLPPEPSAVPPVMSSSSRRLRPNRFGRYSLITRIPSQEEPEEKPLTRCSSFEFLPPSLSELMMSELLEPEEKPLTRCSSFEFLPPSLSELRVVLLGNSWSQRSSVGNFILGETVFNTEEEPDRCLRVRGQLKEKEIVLINTPDLLHPNISQHKLTEHVKNCVCLSAPGPHVFLLVLQPEDFTEEHKLRLCTVLELFSDQSFDHSLVLISTPREESPGFMEQYREHPPLKDMIRKCHYRFLWQKNLELPELLTRLGQIVKENNGEHV